MPYKDKVRAREWHRDWRKANPERVKQIHIEEVTRLRSEVLTYYGGGKLACVRCGFDNIKALSIDHINGDGSKGVGWKKRKAGKSFYRLLRRQGYPKGYQTLCMNCQYLKRFENKEYN